MPSGKNIKPERSLYWRLGLVMMLITAVNTACVRVTPSFNALLARIDQQGVAASTPLYSQAFQLAMGSADKLRVLKRARSYNPAVLSALAKEFMAQPQAEPVALVFFDVLLAAKEFPAALLVWQTMLNQDDHADLLVELIGRSGSEYSGLFDSFDLEYLSRIAVRSEYPALLLLAALEAVRAGQPELAASLVQLAAAKGAVLPANLLWNLGLNDLLLARFQSYTSLEDMPYTLKAAYTADDLEFALKILDQQTDRGIANPSLSLVQAYLHHEAARRGGFYNQRIDQRPLNWPDIGSDSVTVTVLMHGQESRRLYEGLIAEYPHNVEVVRQYLVWLLATGQYARFSIEAENHSLAQADLAVLQLAAAYATEQTGKLLGQLIDMLARYPDDSIVANFGHCMLLKLEAYDAFARQWRKSVSQNPDLDRSLLAAYYAVLTGNYEKALSLFEEANWSDDESLVPFNLGIVALKLKRYKLATEYFTIAAGRGTENRFRALAMLWEARTRLMLGEKQIALRLAEAALSIDQDSGQVRHFLLQLTN